MTAIARALAEVLGLAPAPLSENAVRRILRRWVLLQAGRRADRLLPDPARPDREPAWLLLNATIACKVARCPANTVRELGTTMPAVELVTRAELELEDLQAKWRTEEIAAHRAGRPLPVAELRRRALEVRHTEALLDRVRATRAYQRGMAYLAQELAWCAQVDPVFRAWMRDET